MSCQFNRLPLWALAGALSSGAPMAAWACATCGCTLSADAAAGYSAIPGLRFNFEYDYINQDALRSGTGTATPAQVTNKPSNPALGGGEIEKQTINRYLTMGMSYSPNSEWNVSVLVPYVMRSHTTFGQQPTPYSSSETASNQISGASLSSPGDVKIVGSYQGLLPTHNLGVQLGVKLPTGHYGTAVNFNSGPNAGTPLDASLQAGTGSTDVILGAYYYRAVSQDFDAFVNAQFQSAVKHKQDQPGNDFRPGNSATMSVGLRYEAHPQWVPQLAGEPVAQERRSGGPGGHRGYRRHRGVFESRRDAARDGKPASLRLRADSYVLQARRVPAVTALDGNRRGQLRVLTLEP